jgi:hypothetical protein
MGDTDKTKKGEQGQDTDQNPDGRTRPADAPPTPGNDPTPPVTPPVERAPNQ